MATILDAILKIRVFWRSVCYSEHNDTQRVGTWRVHGRPLWPTDYNSFVSYCVFSLAQWLKLWGAAFFLFGSGKREDDIVSTISVGWTKMWLVPAGNNNPAGNSLLCRFFRAIQVSVHMPKLCNADCKWPSVLIASNCSSIDSTAGRNVSGSKSSLSEILDPMLCKRDLTSATI